MPAPAEVDGVEAVPAAGIGYADLFVFSFPFERWGTAFAGEGCVFGVSFFGPEWGIFVDDWF